MSSADPIPLKVPMIDFSGLEASHPGSERWVAVRTQVMQALESYACFEAVYEEVSRETREALFGKAVKQVFALPLGTKLQNKSDIPYLGYIGQIPNMDYESLVIEEADRQEGAERFAELMWPGGNPTFCDTVQSFSKRLSELYQMVRRIVLESLGVKQDLDSHLQATTYMLRMSELRAKQAEDDTVLPDHQDPNLLTIICQHQIEGLQVHTKCGDWIHTNPLPNSFTVLLGESIKAWTNGRLHPTRHRVRMRGTEPRHSAIFLAVPKEGHLVQAPKELVNEEHPALFKPFDFIEWLHFRFSEEGSKAKDALKAFCGVGGVEAEA